MHKYKKLLAFAGMSMSLTWSGATLAQERLSVLLDFAPWGLQAIAHLAAEKGWYEEAGIVVEVRDGRGSNNTIQLVAAGEADVGFAQLGPMAAAREASGVPLKSFLGVARKGDLAAVVDRSAGLSTVADLKGKKLALFTASPFLPFLDVYLGSGGLTRDDVELLYVDPSAMMTTFTSGQADGALTAGPFGQAVAEATRPAALVTAADAGISYPSYGYFAVESTIEAKGETLAKFVATQVRAIDYIYESDANMDEGVAAIIAQRPDLKLDADLLKRQIEAYRDFLSTPNTADAATGWQSEDDWQAAIDSMVEAEVLSEKHQPSDFYTNEFVGK